MIPVRRFTLTGLARFAEALDMIRAGGAFDIRTLLEDEELTEVLTPRSILKVQRFESRREAAEYLDTIIRQLDGIRDVERDRQLWSWLAACWMDELAPAMNGRRRIGDSARWILATDDYRKYYRHLLAGPFRIYRAHGDNPDRAMALLATPVERPGEVVEQFASRQEIVSNPNLVEAITRLYYDGASRKLKRRAAGKGPGSARRLALVLAQFDLTWDIYGMSADEILDLLPAEFDQFLSE